MFLTKPAPPQVFKHTLAGRAPYRLYSSFVLLNVRMKLKRFDRLTGCLGMLKACFLYRQNMV